MTRWMTMMVVLPAFLLGGCAGDDGDDDKDSAADTGEGAGDSGNGGDTDDGPDSNNNRQACEAFINTYNALECVPAVAQLDPAVVCAAYDDNAIVDCSNIFDCWTANIACDEGVPSNYLEGCPTTCE